MVAEGCPGHVGGRDGAERLVHQRRAGALVLTPPGARVGRVAAVGKLDARRGAAGIIIPAVSLRLLARGEVEARLEVDGGQDGGRRAGVAVAVLAAGRRARAPLAAEGLVDAVAGARLGAGAAGLGARAEAGPGRPVCRLTATESLRKKPILLLATGAAGLDARAEAGQGGAVDRAGTGAAALGRRGRACAAGAAIERDGVGARAPGELRAGAARLGAGAPRAVGGPGAVDGVLAGVGAVAGERVRLPVGVVELLAAAGVVGGVRVRALADVTGVCALEAARSGRRADVGVQQPARRRGGAVVVAGAGAARGGETGHLSEVRAGYHSPGLEVARVLDSSLAVREDIALGRIPTLEDGGRCSGDGAHEGGDGEGAHGEGGEELPGQVGRGRVSRCRGTGGDGEGGLTSLKL